MPRVRFTFGFFALWAAVLTANEYYNNHYPALPIFLLCLAHESGHIFAAGIAGLPPERITFCAAGIRMSVKNGTYSRGLFRELLLLSAGCAVNFALVPLFALAKMRLWAMVSFSLGIFNLLPLSSLDGGRIIRAVCEYISPAADIGSAQKICDIIIIAVFLAYFLFHGFPPPLLPIIIAGLSALEKL
ncbi:MAG: M50 family metallopeptidase [Oscillospiraceae bacterium]|nr:M50 family metallopeptidase [Oscillospiraceae bacterium]